MSPVFTLDPAIQSLARLSVALDSRVKLGYDELKRSALPK